MSESEDDLLQNNVFTFRNENTTICAKGPSLNNINKTGLSFRNNDLTSTMHMPVNFERQMYTGSNFVQRNNYRRGMSPMSLRSVPDFGPRNFNHSNYHYGMGYPRSVVNGRNGSPNSIRSIDSTSSTAAILDTLKNVKLNNNDIRSIRKACNKILKDKERRKAERRRKLKMFLNGTRRKSLEDSSEHGSDFSISSDDGRTIKTTICNENLPGVSHVRDMSHFNTYRGVFQNSSDSLKQNTMRNMFSNSSMTNFSTKERNTSVTMTNIGTREQIQYTTAIENQIPTSKVQNTSMISMKERFQQGFQLPSQRFNKSIARQTQLNSKSQSKSCSKDSKRQLSSMAEEGSDTDKEEIFRGFPQNEIRQDVNVGRKRTLDIEDATYSENKRSKLESQCAKLTESVSNVNTNRNPDDLIFAKPKMPIKRGSTKRIEGFGSETLLAKSRVPLTIEKNNLSIMTVPLEKDNKDIENDTQSDTLLSTTDVSMRPSFIKRKLFTQKLDVAEKTNLSSDNVNSPTNVYSATMRERNKARKLVTSQSCLNREVPGEDSNVIDLIHKIVPPDQINITNIANKTDSCSNKSKIVDKWDVTKFISNDQDISDTYTDEEIFSVSNNNSNKPNKPKQHMNIDPRCKIVMEKLNPEIINKCVNNNNKCELTLSRPISKESNKRSVTDCVKSFWDTDFESDVEFNAVPSWKTNKQNNQEPITQKRSNNHEEKLNSNKITSVSKGILTVRNYKDPKLNITCISQKKQIDRDTPVNLMDKEISEPILQENNFPTVETSKPEINAKSQTGSKKKGIVKEKKGVVKEKKGVVKENVPLNKEQEDLRRNRKPKNCADCNNDKPTDAPLNRSIRLIKKPVNIDNKIQDTKNSTNNKLKLKATQKSKDNKSSPDLKQSKVDISNKITKSGQKTNPKSQKQNVRKQPFRKSKEKSFAQSPKQKTTASSKVPNNNPKTKSTKDLPLKNSTLNSFITRTTRSSREKLSFNSSRSDKSCGNISNISNRSLRLLQRKKNEYK